MLYDYVTRSARKNGRKVSGDVEIVDNREGYNSFSVEKLSCDNYRKCQSSLSVWERSNERLITQS